jgi:apolipoprotein N-acyltransferase
VRLSRATPACNPPRAPAHLQPPRATLLLLLPAAALLGCLGWQSEHTMAALPLLAALWSAAPTRAGAGGVVGSYYLSGSAVLPATWAAFFGEQASPLAGVALWLASAVLLALPWWACWAPHSASPARLAGGLIAALVLVSVPPLGIIGWLNPLLAASVLFPRTGWVGLGAGVVLMLALAAAARAPWRWRWPAAHDRVRADGRPGRRACALRAGAALLCVALAATAAAARMIEPVPPPAGWLALDTALGRTPVNYAETIARQVDLIAAVRAAVEPAGEPAGSPDAAQPAPAPALRVLILPEQVAGRWSAAQQAVWSRLLAPYPAVQVVFGASVEGSGPGRSRNAVLVGPTAPRVLASSRQPVPFSMWRPGAAASYDAQWFARGVSALAGERVLWSICYEDYLVWPFLRSLARERPTLIVSVANGWWVRGSGQDRLQALHVQAWSRLFNLPLLRAVNR